MCRFLKKLEEGLGSSKRTLKNNPLKRIYELYRHTFATRCIERGMNPKTVQVILGHSSVNITMNLYCHVTEDTLISEMSKFEAEESGKGVNRQIGVKVV